MRLVPTDVCHFAVGTTLIFRKLRADGESVRKLCLAAAVLAVHFIDTLRLEATEEY